MSDKVFYKVIADELKSKTMDTALWTQAIATAEGNPDKTEAVYIRLRFLDLKKSALSSLSLAPAAAKSAEPELKPLDSALFQLRSTLAKKLYSQGKPSLYSTLGLHPDASDTVVATAIADFEARNQGGNASAEFKYAKSTLGNPVLREQYDRKLLESISNDLQRTTRSYAVEATHNEYSWWESGRTAVIIGIMTLALLGYFGLNYYKERNNHELQKESLETVRATTDANQMQIQADIDLRNEALRIADERQRREMDLRSNASDRMLEQQRLEQERRTQAEQQRLKLQQDQADNLRINKEKQYYVCLNQQLLSQRDMTNADASARCSMYR